MSGASEQTPSPGARRVGAAVNGAGASALLAAAVGFTVAGPPYATNVAAVVLYVLGLAAGLTGSVLLWMGWPPGAGRGVLSAGLLLVVGCGVVSLGRAAPGGVQLVLMALTALVLAGSVAAARRAAAP